MKYIYFLALLFFAQISYSINVELSSYSFYGLQPYTEMYFRVEGKSIKWETISGKKTASANIIIIISNVKGEITAYDKFTLTTVATDSISDFLEVKRFKLLPGEYTVKLEAEDSHQLTGKLEMEQKLIVAKEKAAFTLSDLIPLAKIKKDSTSSGLIRNGYYMEPLSYHYAGVDQYQLDFYLEAYHSGLVVGDYFVQCSINEGTTKNINPVTVLTKYQKLAGVEVEPILLSFPVKSLRSGDYHFIVNIIDKSKKVIATRRTDFTKSNPEADIAYLETYNTDHNNSFVQKLKAEDMDYILKANLPITGQHQISTLGELLKSNKIKSQRQFIYQLWKSKAPSNPEESFKAYMEVAKAVDKKFYTNVGYGFQSDRGHIFLKYGKPSNVLTVETEVDAPPYEIWYYNNMAQTNQTNVRFLFYNASLAHNDFKLLHSTCLGERVNPSWEVELYKSVPNERVGNTVDATQVGENWNRNARRYFNEY
jgi:GWxTD domain-containing protein